MNLDDHFEFLDELPEAIFQPVVTLHHGSLRERVEGILAWRHALLRGELPDVEAIGWPQRAIAETIRLRLDGLDLVSFCRNEEALVDQILKDVCAAITSILRREAEGVHGLFEDTVSSAHKRERETSQLAGDDADWQSQAPGAGPPQSSSPPPSAGQGTSPGEAPPQGSGEGRSDSPRGEGGETLYTLQAAPEGIPEPEGTGEATAGSGLAGEGMDEGGMTAGGVVDGTPPEIPNGDADHAVALAGGGGAAGGGQTAFRSGAPLSEQTLAQLGDGLAEHWKKVLAHWREVESVFRGMGSRLGRGWDLSSGELQGRGWREFVAYRRLIREHPQLVEIVDSLGREQAGAGEGPLAEARESLETPGEGSASEEVFVHSESPLSTAGVSRSDDIARMLPQEAAFLGHPKLKMLWHVRRAEQGLLSYHVEGVLSEHRPGPLRELTDRPEPRRESARQKGPLIVCLDTSASLHGEPERIAKAVCLEVLRLANQSGRRCYLYAFSGPGQVLEMALRFDPPGLRRLLRFLSQRFDGGTDVRDPIQRALRKVREADWRRADLLLVSDGRFSVPPSVVKAVSRAREKQNLRLVGLTLGPWASDGLGRICRPVYRFRLPSALVEAGIAR